MKASLAEGCHGCVSLIQVCHKHSNALKKKPKEKGNALHSAKLSFQLQRGKNPPFAICLKTAE